MDVYKGRAMQGVERGEIKKLLVMESLPKPINFTGGMDPLTYGGSFTLERVLGTVPVEADGSVYFKAPANRLVYFSVLDENFMKSKERALELIDIVDKGDRNFSFAAGRRGRAAIADLEPARTKPVAARSGSTASRAQRPPIRPLGNLHF